MDFTFLQSSGAVAFYRSDAEQAEWTQEEMTLNCTFPYIPGKVIERGMVILFQDPSIGDWQAFEIRQCTVMPGEFYQQFTAESIAISELTDCHIQQKQEFTDVTAKSALSAILKGTGWNVGVNEETDTSSGDINRGSVWQAVSVIAENWNVYIMPRVTVNADGISKRYLDIFSHDGVNRGLRLAVNKNVTDPCVTYDDSELYTALYGYGGTYTEGSGSNKKTVEYTFKDVVWEKTSSHPAKPKGQAYLEWPEKTALYGRNGKPRFGYYQNVNVKDPNKLLKLTWRTLKQCADPKISISGTVTDLKRIGYTDVPMRLHDMAIIELEPVGLQFYKQIIKLTVDLLDGTKNLPEIGNYIPNIIYINRATEEHATGGGGGGSGPSTKTDLVLDEYETRIYDTGQTVGMYARIVDEHGDILNQAGLHIDPITGVLIYAEDTKNMIGSKFSVTDKAITAEVEERKQQGESFNTRIEQTSKAITLEAQSRSKADEELSGKISVQAGRIDIVVTKNGQVKAGVIVDAINADSSVTISADRIELDGEAVADSLQSQNLHVQQLTVTGEAIFDESINAPQIESNVSILGDADCDSLVFDNSTVSWKSQTFTTYNWSDTHAFMYQSGQNTITILGKIMTSNGTPITINYMGK